MPSQMTETTAEQAVAKVEFARMLGVAPSYITKLRKLGRLVLDDRGRVVVEESRKRIRATSDPNRSDAADRWAQLRGTPVDLGGDEPRTETRTPAPGDDVAGEPMSHADAKTLKEFYLAENARLDYEERCGQLLQRDEVRTITATAAVSCRAALEGLPRALAPRLVGKDETQILALLTEHMEVALSDLSAALQKAAKKS